MGDVTPLNNRDYDPLIAENTGGTDKVAFADSGAALIAFGTTVPTDADSGYATGCLFLHTDGGDATALYVNEGTSSSCNFNAVTVAA